MRTSVFTRGEIEMTDKDIARFWSYVDKECSEFFDCWEWIGSKRNKKDKYGRFSIHGRWFKANRVAYEIYNPPIPEGLIVMHECDNPSCVNPDHLKLGTQNDNLKDMVARGRSSKGKDRWNYKFTDQDIESMIDLYRLGYTQKYIAEKLGVSQPYISQIVNKLRR